MNRIFVSCTTERLSPPRAEAIFGDKPPNAIREDIEDLARDLFYGGRWTSGRILIPTGEVASEMAHAMLATTIKPLTGLGSVSISRREKISLMLGKAVPEEVIQRAEEVRKRLRKLGGFDLILASPEVIAGLTYCVNGHKLQPDLYPQILEDRTLRI